VGAPPQSLRQKLLDTLRQLDTAATSEQLAAIHEQPLSVVAYHLQVLEHEGHIALASTEPIGGKLVRSWVYR